MSNKNLGQTQPGKAKLYEIRLKGHLDEQWSEWFDDLTITYDEDDDTILCGPVIDQAALHGLLRKVRDLGLSLISVNQVESNQERRFTDQES